MQEDQLVEDEPNDEPNEDDAAWQTWTSETRPGRRRGSRAESDGVHLTRRAFGYLIVLLVIIIIALLVLLMLKGGGSGNKANPNAGALRQVESAHNALVTQRRTCPTGSEQLTCRREEAGALTLAYQNFTVDLDRITLPTGANDARDVLDQDASLLSNAYDELSVAATNSAYDRITTREDVSGLAGTFDRHYLALVSVLRAG